MVDVRETWERAMAGVIEPSVHIPLGELERGTTAALGGLNPAGPTVVYCAHGARSLRGAQLLRERYGFREAVSLRGGYQAWKIS